MPTPLRLACLPLVALAIVASGGARSEPASDAAEFARAASLFRAQRYPEAYGRFVRLANHGHAQSAQMALMMYANGPAVFGSDWDADPGRLREWQALAAGPALHTAGR